MFTVGPLTGKYFPFDSTTHRYITNKCRDKVICFSAQISSNRNKNKQFLSYFSGFNFFDFPEKLLTNDTLVIAYFPTCVCNR